jgi:enoyl-CoA hydratase/carnithine racemase
MNERERLQAETRQRIQETGKYENIIYEKEGGIATLTFNRPQVMNAQNPVQIFEQRYAVEDARDDDTVRVLTPTGAGRGFHAGDDIKEMFLNPDWQKGIRDRRGKVGITKGIIRQDSYLQGFYKPVIAAVNGPAVGAGLEIALECDIRIASPNAKFGWLFVLRNMNSTGTADGFMMLLHMMGISRALEFMLCGELMEAEEALSVGLVRKVVPQEQLMDEAKAVAHKLMRGAPLAQQAIKRCVNRAMFDPSSLPELVPTLEYALLGTEDHIEGARSFTEKREPVWKMR